MDHHLLIISGDSRPLHLVPLVSKRQSLLWRCHRDRVADELTSCCVAEGISCPTGLVKLSVCALLILALLLAFLSRVLLTKVAHRWVPDVRVALCMLLHVKLFKPCPWVLAPLVGTHLVLIRSLLWMYLHRAKMSWVLVLHVWVKVASIEALKNWRELWSVILCNLCQN